MAVVAVEYDWGPADDAGLRLPGDERAAGPGQQHRSGHENGKPPGHDRPPS